MSIQYAKSIKNVVKKIVTKYNGTFLLTKNHLYELDIYEKSGKLVHRMALSSLRRAVKDSKYSNVYSKNGSILYSDGRVDVDVLAYYTGEKTYPTDYSYSIDRGRYSYNGKSHLSIGCKSFVGEQADAILRQAGLLKTTTKSTKKTEVKSLKAASAKAKRK